MAHNPQLRDYAKERHRGYAARSFDRAYQNMRGYDWFAAIRSEGYGPSRADWIREALRLYDMMSARVATREESHDLVALIVKDQSQMLYAEYRPRLTSYMGADGRRKRMLKDTADARIDDPDVHSLLGAAPDIADAVAERDVWERFVYGVDGALLAQEGGQRDRDRAVWAAAVSLYSWSPTEIARVLRWKEREVRYRLLKIRDIAEKTFSDFRE